MDTTPIRTDKLATIHASGMATILGGYTRSAALVVDRSTLLALRDLLAEATGPDKYATQEFRLIATAITEAVDGGLR